MEKIKGEEVKLYQVSFKLNPEKDRDIISRLQSCNNVQGYLKKLIRLDMLRDITNTSVLDLEKEVKEI